MLAEYGNPLCACQQPRRQFPQLGSVLGSSTMIPLDYHFGRG